MPNFSEGRDPAVVEALATVAGSVPAVAVLDQTMDADHNRSVLTFAGPPEAVVEAAVRAVGVAVERIDLTRHHGVHPRIGAADVVPFVPLRGIALEECAELARRAGAEIWRRYRVPVYLYEAAATHPDRQRLENVRRGQFEGLLSAVRTDPSRRPDIGEPALHPTAGATAVGARKFLIAWNVNLASNDVHLARAIARRIRASSGGLPGVKAMGVLLQSRNLAQISMNLTDFEVTPLHRVFDVIRCEAEAAGVDIAGTEIIGLIPKSAWEAAAAHFLRCENFRNDRILENRLSRSALAANLFEQWPLAGPEHDPDAR